MLIANSKPANGGVREPEHSFFIHRSRVSWLYPDASLQFLPSVVIHPKPPHYHDSLLSVNRMCCNGSFDNDAGESRNRLVAVGGEDIELNIELLVGAKYTEAILESYETDVGFHCYEPDSTLQNRVPALSLSRNITEKDIAIGKQRWVEMVKLLAEGPLMSRSSSRDYNGAEGSQITSYTNAHSTGLIHFKDLRSPTELDFIDMTDSEHSVDSDPVPSTPKPRNSYPNIAFSQPSPSVLDFSPSRSLNAAASSFVPTSTTPAKVPPIPYSYLPFISPSPSPSPSPTYTNFTFPSLNSSIQALPSLPPNLKKDEQGFYTEVKISSSGQSSNRASHRSSSSLLPSFLTDPSHRTRRASKTREIVDQLRSASANDLERPHSIGNLPTRPVSTPHHWTIGTPPLEEESSVAVHIVDFEEEDDGWHRVNVAEIEDDLETKSRRTRNLVEALGRNRTGSAQGSEPDSRHGGVDWELPPDTSKSSGSSQSRSASSTRRKGSRHRSRKSSSRTHASPAAAVVPIPYPSLSSSPPLPTPVPNIQSFFPVMYPVYTGPHPYAASSMLAYKQMPPMPLQPSWFASHAAYGSPPFGMPMALQSPAPVSGVYDAIGMTGMRHAQW